MFDFEYRPSYSIRVRATDVAAGVSTETAITVAITDVGDITAEPSSVAENLPAGTLVAELSNIAPGIDPARHDFRLVSGDGDGDNAAFTLTSYFYGEGTSPGEVWELRTDEEFDFEDKSVYRIRLEKDFDLGTLPSLENMVTITVTDADDAPTATADGYTTDEDVPLTVAAPGVLANDTDQDGDPLHAELVGAAQHGTVTLAESGGFTYSPDAGFSGEDAFTYRAGDGSGVSPETTVTIDVAPVADPPETRLEGFFEPVEMGADVLNVVKGGSTVPLTFEVYRGETEVTDPAALSPFSLRPIACPGEEATAEEVTFTTTGPSQLRYTDGRFQQNWKTPKAKGCYQVTVSADGESLSADFRLR
jgi:VCBS repeat-containing protein